MCASTSVRSPSAAPVGGDVSRKCSYTWPMGRHAHPHVLVTPTFQCASRNCASTPVAYNDGRSPTDSCTHARVFACTHTAYHVIDDVLNVCVGRPLEPAVVDAAELIHCKHSRHVDIAARGE